MKTFKYKTLKGLLRQVGGSYFTYHEYISGRFHHKNHGWVNYVLSDEARDEAAREFAAVLWSRVTEDRVYMCRHYYGRTHGILERLWINKRNGKAEYCAGQYYPGEIRCIQGILRNGG